MDDQTKKQNISDSNTPDVTEDGSCECVIDEEQREELLSKADKEFSTRKELGGWQTHVVNAIALAFCVFMLVYNARIISIPNMWARDMALGLSILLGFLLFPFNKKGKNRKISVWTILLAVVAASPCFYLMINYTTILTRGVTAGTVEIVFAIILLLALLEVVRRTAGNALPIMSLLFIVYGMFGQIMPGVLNHKNISLSRIVSSLYLGQDGVFGVAFGVATTYIFLFIFFGSLISQTGMGQFFNDFSNSIAGDKPGGPAKVAVISSALMGMISGSGAANVVTTGTFTIPLMKKLGYSSSFAGAVEAVASSGGQILPPVMGAAAFVMAEFLGCSYNTVMLAALMPALLYFFSVYIVVDMEAKRLKLMGQDRSTLPKLKNVLLKQGVMVLPLLVLIFMLVRGYTAIYSCFFSMAALVLINIIFGTLAKFGHGDTKLLTPRDYLRILIGGGKSAVAILLSCAIIGIVVGIISLTGLGLMLANYILQLSHGSLFITMVLTMIVCIILGMGLPITPCYIIVSIIAVPALVKMGVAPIAAHMFVLYFGAMSAITPPVALAAFAAAGICGDSAWKVGWQAVRLGIAGFLIPFAFVYGPQLVLVNATVTNVLWTLGTCIVGIVALGAGSIGYFNMKLPIPVRIALIVSAVLCIIPETTTDFIGLGIVLAIGAFIFLKTRRVKKPA
jgi:TRAP transporter 4TM/12TM fusion protein